MGAGRKQFELWLNGDEDLIVAFKAKVRRDKLPDEWLEFVEEAWLHEDITRASECKRDSVRDPRPGKRSDKTKYRVHFLEQKLETVVEKINTMGRAKFDPDFEYADGQKRAVFEVSWTIIVMLKSFRVKGSLFLYTASGIY